MPSPQEYEQLLSNIFPEPNLEFKLSSVADANQALQKLKLLQQQLRNLKQQISHDMKLIRANYPIPSPILKMQAILLKKLEIAAKIRFIKGHKVSNTDQNKPISPNVHFGEGIVIKTAKKPLDKVFLVYSSFLENEKQQVA